MSRWNPCVPPFTDVAKVMNAVSDEVFLGPGEVYFGGPDVTLRTLLGSCVGVTVWHPAKQVGGMGHFVLPRHERARVSAGELDARYAEDLGEVLCSNIRSIGTRTCEYRAQLFGAGAMFSSGGQIPAYGASLQIKNIVAARQLVRRCGFQLVNEHLGGRGYRTLRFDVRSGSVELRWCSDV